VDIAANISSVKQRMDDAIASNDRLNGSVRLVAVSKTKPLELLVAAYEVSFPYYSVSPAQTYYVGDCYPKHYCTS